MPERHRRSLLVLLVVLVGGCTTDWHADTFGLGDTPTIVLGTVTLDVPGAAAVTDHELGSCEGSGAYAGFGAGMEVVLTDQHGSVVAESRTRDATFQPPRDPGPDSRCVANFVLKDAEYHSATYTIAAGESGTAVYATATFSGHELEGDRRAVTLAIEDEAG